MSRLVTPLILLGAAGVVLVYNQQPDRKLIFPLLDVFTRDPVQQGWISFGILTALGVLSSVMAGWGIWQDRRTD